MVVLLLPSLNYDEKDPKFQLLGKIFDFMNKKRTLNYLSLAGIKNRSKVLLSIKILFIVTVKNSTDGIFYFMKFNHIFFNPS